MEKDCKNCDGRGDTHIGAKVCFMCKGTGKEKPQQRSVVMNRCLHKALTEIAADLEQQGIERCTIIEDLEGYEAPITREWMKEVYKSIVYTMYRKTSTTDLSNKEMIDSWEVFSKFLSEQYGVSYTWPSQEAQYWESYTE